LNPDQSFSFAPKSIEIIVIALPGAEDVHDDIPVVEQEPAGVQRTFLVMRQNAFFLQAQLDVLEDGANLPLAVSGTEDKVVRKAAKAADIQQNDITGLFIAGDFHSAAGYIDAFQSLILPVFIS
jgi:hypothetical protein